MQPVHSSPFVSVHVVPRQTCLPLCLHQQQSCHQALHYHHQRWGPRLCGSCHQGKEGRKELQEPLTLLSLGFVETSKMYLIAGDACHLGTWGEYVDWEKSTCVIPAQLQAGSSQQGPQKPGTFQIKFFPFYLNRSTWRACTPNFLRVERCLCTRIAWSLGMWWRFEGPVGCLLTLGKVMAQLPLQCPWSSIHSVALSVHVPVRRDKGGWPLLQTQHWNHWRYVLQSHLLQRSIPSLSPWIHQAWQLWRWLKQTRSLTLWVRPGIKPAASCILVGFISTVPWWELPVCLIYALLIIDYQILFCPYVYLILLSLMAEFINSSSYSGWWSSVCPLQHTSIMEMVSLVTEQSQWVCWVLVSSGIIATFPFGWF